MFSQAPYRAVVAGVGSYLPEKILTNADLEKMVDTTDEWIVSRTGIRERHILAEGEATSHMATEAGRRALDNAGMDPEDVDLIIVGTFTPDYYFPTTACLVQDRLGCTRAGGFDLAAACSGFIYSVSTAAAYISAGLYENVLVIGADANSRIVDWEDRNTCVLFGDGASAVVMKRGKGKDRGVLSTYLRSDGGGWSFLHQPAGGSLRPPTHETVEQRLHHIKMDGREVFKRAGRAMTDAANTAIEKAGLTKEDIALVVPHQANIRIIDTTVKRLGIPREQFVINIEKYGNTVAASIGLALHDAVTDGRIQDDQNILIVGFGAGLTWGGVVIRWGA